MVEAHVQYVIPAAIKPFSYEFGPPPDAPPRESIEVRAFAFFAPE